MIDADRLLSLLALLKLTPPVAMNEPHELAIRVGTLEAVEAWVRSQVDAPTLRDIERGAA